MADVNRGNRPLSPHLQVYRLPQSAIMSIFHRITGVGLTLGAALVVWWLLAAATGPEYFEFADGMLTSILGLLILFGSTWALCYHLLTGLRHLCWDLGFGYDLEQVKFSGQAIIVASGVLTVFIWIVAI